MALKETDYLVTITEDEKKTSFTIDGETLDCWIEDKAVQVYTKNPAAQFYNQGITNDVPLRGVAFFYDKSCGCTKPLTGKLIITIKEITE